MDRDELTALIEVLEAVSGGESTAPAATGGDS